MRRLLIIAACCLTVFISRVWAADPAQNLEIVVSLPLTDDAAPYGIPVLEGVQLAIEEANASGIGPHIELKTYGDKGSDDMAKRLAGSIVASRAALVLGPAFSTNSLTVGPVYASYGIVSLATTCTSDLITQNGTTFRVLFKNSDQGETLTLYLSRVLYFLGRQHSVHRFDTRCRTTVPAAARSPCAPII